MAETQTFSLTELFTSLPKCVYTSDKCEGIESAEDELQNFRTKEFNLTDAEKRLIESILQDDSVELVSQLKILTQKSLNRENFEGGQSRDPPEILDSGIVSNLLRLCCAFDSMNCASALINGEIGMVPLVNEMDDTGRSALHTAAEMHAKKCIELLLRKRARTDMKSKDGRAQLPLELALFSRRMDVVWNPNDSVEDLLVCLSEKDLMAVKLLAGKTKEVAEVAYACAIECRVVSLAALLMVAVEKVNASILTLRPDADLSSKDKTTVYECVIREALSLGWTGTSSLRVNKWTTIWSESEKVERRKLLLCEMELLQLFGAVARGSGCTDRRTTSPLIRAAQAGDEAVIELLLKTNIDVNDSDAEGNSALHWSLKIYKDPCLQQIRIVCLLLKHGARVSLKNLLGLTALHIAAANGNKQALQILLSEDPDSVDSTTEMLETPLFFAAKNDFLDCAQLLLCLGANTEVLNLRRQRPIDLAKSQDMRFILSPTNISFTSWAFQRKYSAWLRNDQVISETCEEILPIRKKDSTPERICLTPKTELYRNYGSPGGSLRGAKWHHANSKEEIQQTKLDAHSTHSLVAEELKWKIFVGGLPPSLDSGSLGKFFEEQFGSVEDAVVIGSQAGSQIQSRGFGFVTFKDKQSVSTAIQAHYVTIKGKQVEIKSAIPKCLLLAEFQKLSPQQQQEQQNNQIHHQAVSPNENKTDKGTPAQKSLVDGLPCIQQKSHSSESKANVSTTSADQSMPKWVSVFKEWFPNFLQEVSKRLREGEWYPLSSLKADFRATCGLELDHASLGYHKLSDFMRSLPGICRMKVVPIGGRGPATHMVLLPSLLMPNDQLVQSITMEDISCDMPFDDNLDDDFDDIKFLEDLSLVSYAHDFSGGGLAEENSSYNERFTHKTSEANQAQTDALHSVHPRFLEFLKPDLLFHARPWLMNQNNEDGTGNDGERSGGEGRRGEEWSKGKNPTQKRRHLVLEALARIRKSSSVFFLREFDYYDNYKVSMERGKCFACSQGKMLWANFPCQHSLWCSDCKLLAIRAAGTSEHKCVVCNAEVEEIIWKPWNEKLQQTCSVPNDQFPPFDPNHVRT